MSIDGEGFRYLSSICLLRNWMADVNCESSVAIGKVFEYIFQPDFPLPFVRGMVVRGDALANFSSFAVGEVVLMDERACALRYIAYKDYLVV